MDNNPQNPTSKASTVVLNVLIISISVGIAYFALFTSSSTTISSAQPQPQITITPTLIISNPANNPSTLGTYNQSTADDYDSSYEITRDNWECTGDCSGHDAGFEWAEENGISDPDDCGGNSNSFIEGCEAYANESRMENEDDGYEYDESDY